MVRRGRSLFVVFIAALAFNGSSLADPCGMVPPVSLVKGPPIKRVGAQKTYVFFKNGVESFVIRPGFEGRVDNFGMLIPFPTPPAIRKVPDNIFEHIVKAVDPPEVVVNLTPAPKIEGIDRKILSPSPKLSIRTVKVLSQEAVGMYQVAVLQAGSANALKGWMDRNGYKYPKGMDKPCNDYIKLGWCFVAVKTRVAGKKGVAPRPGMRKTALKFPKGGVFTGKVQAMGFRFKTKKLVVPMRLSAFNEGRLRNVVYLLTSSPKMINSIPKEYVRRQVSGKELYRNVTGPLPLRIIGGDARTLSKGRWRSIHRRRDPVPHNGLARELFASDLLAVKSGKLALPHEETKKVLLRIGERLGMRGKHNDRLNRQVLSREREMTVRQGLQYLKTMTLTIVDGDFPRDVLARDNLSFSNFKMPATKNHARYYNTRQMRVLSGALIKKRGTLTNSTWHYRTPKKLRGRDRKPRPLSGLKEQIALIKQLENGKLASEALKKLVQIGQQVVPLLLGEAIEGHHMPRRGWSIVGLSEIGGPKAQKGLGEVVQNKKQPKIVRSWSASALIKLTGSVQKLAGFLQLVRSLPATRRPFALRLFALLRGDKSALPHLLAIANADYSFRRSLAPQILVYGAAALTKVMIGDKNNGVRRLAAGYLGTIAQSARDSVAKAVIDAYQFNDNATQPPWGNLALFVPSIGWTKAQARQLVGHLLAWMLWCDNKRLAAPQKQIHNNIRSLSLARIAGYRSPGWSRVGIQRWLTIWGTLMGCPAVKQLLERQKLATDSRYSKILTQLGCSR